MVLFIKICNIVNFSNKNKPQIRISFSKQGFPALTDRRNVPNISEGSLCKTEYIYNDIQNDIHNDKESD